MSDFINSVDVLGDDAVTDSILKRTIESYADNVITKVGQGAFNSCKNLTSVDLPYVTLIEDSAFYGCSSLNTVILRSETMVTINAVNAFNSTLIASGTGYIYVPRALLSDEDATKDYRRATNWTTYQFRALEDWTVDGTITGELDPTKI